MGARLQFTLLIIIILTLRINAKSFKKQKEEGTDTLISGNLYEIKLNEEENVTDSSQNNFAHFQAHDRKSTIKIRSSTIRTTKKKNKRNKQLPKKSSPDVTGVKLEKLTPEIRNKKVVDLLTENPSINVPHYSKSDDVLTETLKLSPPEFEITPSWRQHIYDIIELPIDLTQMSLNTDIKVQPDIFKKREIEYSMKPTVYKRSKVPTISEFNLEKTEQQTKLKETLHAFQKVMHIISKMDMYISGVLQSHYQKFAKLYDNAHPTIL